MKFFCSFAEDIRKHKLFQNAMGPFSHCFLQRLTHNTLKNNVAISFLSQINATEIALLLGGRHKEIA